MSALNVCHKEDRAIIMQDAACYDPDGVVIEFVDKGVEVPEMGCFVACTGARVAPFFMSRLLPKFFSDIDDLGDYGEPALDRIYDQLADDLARWGSRGIMVVVAGWSKKHDRPRIVTYARGVKGDGFGGDVGYNMHPKLDGPARAAWLRHHGMEFNIIRFDAMRDGLRLLELQRSMLLPRGEGKPPAYLVGGHVMLTEVSRTGITQRIIHTWPEDQVGERIRPTPAVDFAANPSVVPIAGMNRAERRRLAKTRRVA